MPTPDRRLALRDLCLAAGVPPTPEALEAVRGDGDPEVDELGRPWRVSNRLMERGDMAGQVRRVYLNGESVSAIAFDRLRGTVEGYPSIFDQSWPGGSGDWGLRSMHGKVTVLWADRLSPEVS